MELPICKGKLNHNSSFEGLIPPPIRRLLFAGNRELFQSAIFDALVTKDFENQKLPKKMSGKS